MKTMRFDAAGPVRSTAGILGGRGPAWSRGTAQVATRGDGFPRRQTVMYANYPALAD